MKKTAKRILGISAICLVMLFTMILSLLLLISFVLPDDKNRRLECVEVETVPTIPEQIGPAEETTDTISPNRKISAVQNADGTREFLLTLEEFIESYNRLYEADHETPWLSPADEWYAFTGKDAPFSGMQAVRLEFDPDKNVHNDPDVWVYVLKEGGNICEVSLGMHEHDWTQWRYEVFQKQCYYTLSVFYPELTGEEIRTLFDLLYTDAAANESVSQSVKPRPAAIRFRDPVGCYGFIHSGVIRINIIPVDPLLLEAFTKEGGVISREPLNKCSCAQAVRHHR